MTSTVFRTIDDLPDRIAIFPLAGALLFPRALLPLNIFEPRYLNMIDDARASHNVIGMVQSLGSGPRARPDVARVGCLGVIEEFQETNDARYIIALKGVCRFRIDEEFDLTNPYREVKPSWSDFADDLSTPDIVNDALKAELMDDFNAYLQRNALQTNLKKVEAAPLEIIINRLSSLCPFSTIEKQALLEYVDLKERCKLLRNLLKHSGGRFSGGSNTLQ